MNNSKTKLFNEVNAGCWEYDFVTDRVTWSQQMLRICGVEANVLMKHEDYLRLVHPEDREQAKSRLLGAIATKSGYMNEMRITGADGKTRHVIENVQIMLNAFDEITGIIGVVWDLSVQQTPSFPVEMDEHYDQSLIDKHSEFMCSLDLDANTVLRNVAFEEPQYRSIVEQCVVGVFIVQNNYFVYTNPQLDQMWGSVPLLGTCVLDMIHPEDRLYVAEQIVAQREGNRIGSLCHRTIRQDGTIIYIEVHYSRILHKGKMATLGTVLDVTERKATEQLNEYIAYHDYLTDLPNRRMLEKQLAILLKQNEQYNKTLAILLIDLDRFKLVNDTLGHEIGDALLKLFAAKLKACLDTGLGVYRIGGDEFGIILTEMEDEQEINRVTHTIIQMTKEDFIVEGYELHLSISMGIGLAPQDGNTVGSLFKHADTALYYAKSQGRDQFQYYSNALNLYSFKHFVLSNDLRKALSKNELFIQYMPRIHAQTTEIVGVEALLRWNHPDWGLVAPTEFIPIAEETGLIIPIGEWVLWEACKQNRRWQEMRHPAITVSVNFSVQQLLQPTILQTIDLCLKDTGLSPEYLEIEITESSFISNEKEVIDLLAELKKRKIKVSLDDFGTGFSSLYLLKKLSLDTIKIDKSFVEEMLTNPINKSIIECILSLAKAMEMSVVAEGVETAEQYAFLKFKQCDEIQGYYFSRPLDVEGIVWLLKNKQTSTLLTTHRQASSIKNRRHYSRLNLSNPVMAVIEMRSSDGSSLEIGEKDVLVTNIGPKGLNFLLAFKLCFRSDVSITFRIQIYGHVYELIGKIAWFEEQYDNEYVEYGIQFEDQDNPLLDSITLFNLRSGYSLKPALSRHVH